MLRCQIAGSLTRLNTDVREWRTYKHDNSDSVQKEALRWTRLQ